MDLKIKDVAELLNISETTVRRWLSRGQIPAYRLHHQYRFSRIEIENWMMSCRLKKNSKQCYPFREKQTYLFQNHKKKRGQEVRKGMQQFSLFRAIHHGGVLHNLQASSKEGMICETMKIIANDLGFDPSVISDLFMDRENLMPTALNNGIAVPHTRDFLFQGVTDMVVVVFLKDPIDWGALDKCPVHTLFFLFALDDKRHLHLLAKLAHLSSDAEALQFLRSKPQEKKLLEYIKEWEIKMHHPTPSI